MKYLIIPILCVLIVACASKKKTKTITQDKKSVQNLSKIDPMFLDTVFVEGPSGNLVMKVQMRKDIDTIYVEEARTGNLKMQLVVPNIEK